MVRRMFEVYVHGVEGRPVGSKGLTELLNREGLLYRGGKAWSKQRVQERLADPVYVGEHYYDKAESRTGKVKPRDEWVLVALPQIIDRELFDRTAELRRQRRPVVKRPPSVTSSPALLTGLLMCGKCGARMSIETAKGGAYRYYNCSNYIRKGKSACEGHRVPQEGDTAALCSLGFAPNEQGTVSQLVAVPTVGMDWLSGARVNPNFSPNFDLSFDSSFQKAQILPSVLQHVAYSRPTILTPAVPVPPD